MAFNQKKVISGSEILGRIEKLQIQPAYFVYGSESHLIDRIVSGIASGFLGDIQKEINYFSRYAPDSSIDEILALCAGSGLFSSRKLVMYKDIQNLKKPNFERLLKYLEKPNPDICLILIARTEQIKLSRYDQLMARMTAVNAKPLQEGELANFIRREFQEHQKSVSKDGIESLIFLVGNQIHDLKTEIAQVCNFHPDKKEIGAGDIEEVVGAYVTKNVFDYIKAIARKDLHQALFILHQLLERGETPHSVLALLLRHITILWKIYGMNRSGLKNDYEISRKLGLYSGHFAEYKSQLAGWSPRQLRNALQLIGESDRHLKSTQIGSDLILDILSYKLVNSK